MRSALLTNSATAAAKVAPNPAATAAAAGQAAAAVNLPNQQYQSSGVLSANRAPSVPKKTDGIFEKEGLDSQKDGATPTSIEDKKFKATKKRLLSVA